MDTDFLLFLATLPPLGLVIWLRRRQRQRIRRDPDHPLHDARPWPLRVQLALLAGYLALVAVVAAAPYL
jgi:hypothetical protein